MSRTSRYRGRLVALCVSYLAMFWSDANACMVCIPYPQKTVGDELINAEVVVLAREREPGQGVLVHRDRSTEGRARLTRDRSLC